MLAPTVNLHRTPHGGRHFENLSEDPLLTGRVGRAFVQGVQAGGVATTVKHFVANDSETDRFTADVLVDDRTLRELYLAPFEAIVRVGGAWAVMAAYNAVNGTTMTENVLLRDTLKGEWGFDGVVMSDWFAARSLAAAGAGLLDLVMPGPDGPWGEALIAAVRAGEVQESAVDDKVLRILRLAARVGALDGIPPAASIAQAWPDEEVGDLLRATAAAGFVLARNEGAVLPLDRASLTRIAVLGPNAAVARTLGGGSATVMPRYVASPLDGIRAALGEGVEVVHASGGRPTDRLPVAPLTLLTLPDGSGPGLEARFLDAGGTVLGRERRYAAALTWSGVITEGLPVRDVASVELHGRLRAPQTGTYLVGGSGVGSFRLEIDGRTVLDRTVSLQPGADIIEAMMRPPQAYAQVKLADGDEVPFVLRYLPGGAGEAFGGVDIGMLMVQLNVGLDLDADAELERAVTEAAAADVAVVVGTTEEVESEGFDRSDLALPGRQDELVARVAAVNPRTVVVVNAGAPVLLPWADDVAAVLLAWFPGQEFGNALADVLLGLAEPGGRLPTTWPRVDAAHPSVTPVRGKLRYDEGLFIGYRAYDRDGRTPRYPFGHGLGYTQWAYDKVELPDQVTAGDDVTVRVSVRNTGPRAGRQVLQVYLSRPASSVVRPVRWLAGYAPVQLDAGQSTRAEIAIADRGVQHWDTTGAGWVTEPGTFRLEVGPSSRDLPLADQLTVAG